MTPSTPARFSALPHKDVCEKPSWEILEGARTLGMGNLISQPKKMRKENIRLKKESKMIMEVLEWLR